MLMSKRSSFIFFTIWLLELNFCFAGEEERQLCDSILVRGITEFLVNAPTAVTAPHNLRYPAINLCKTAVHHQDIDVRPFAYCHKAIVRHSYQLSSCFMRLCLQVRLSCVQQVYRVFRESPEDLSRVFMREIGPRLLYQLHQTSSFSTKKEIKLFDAMLDTVLLMFDKTKEQFSKY